ncbi:hypothetical protein B0H13DRAFT_1916801 [Mycena leptocephala]|nr:hypothetical protein B0H13DRAFT_1916801 [Mycena leptocephala]
MSFFASLFSGRKISPPVIDLSTESSASTINTNVLYSDPRRYRFSSRKTFRQHTPKSSAQKSVAGPTVIKIDKDLSHLPLRSSVAPHTPILKTSSAGLLNILRDEISGLLSQHLLGDDHTDLLELILGLTSQKFEIVEQTIPILLQETPLGQTARQALIDAIMARILNHQINLLQYSGHPAKSNAPIASTSNASAAPNAPAITTAEHTLDITTNVHTFKSSSSKGTFRTFTTSSDDDLQMPPPTATLPQSGDLFIHLNSQSKTKQVWMYKISKWENITEYWKKEKWVVHPTIPERVLTVRSDETPNWILRSSAEIKTRDRAKSKKAGHSEGTGNEKGKGKALGNESDSS